MVLGYKLSVKYSLKSENPLAEASRIFRSFICKPIDETIIIEEAKRLKTTERFVRVQGPFGSQFKTVLVDPQAELYHGKTIRAWQDIHLTGDDEGEEDDVDFHTRYKSLFKTKAVSEGRSAHDLLPFEKAVLHDLEHQVLLELIFMMVTEVIKAMVQERSKKKELQ